jgi:hypothetical protein
METHAEKRKKWFDLIKEQKSSGKNAAQWCREKKLSYSLFLYWRNQIKSTGQTLIVYFGNGIKVEANHGFDEDVLRRLVSILQGCNQCSRE